LSSSNKNRYGKYGSSNLVSTTFHPSQQHRQQPSQQQPSHQQSRSFI
jgi:hypothetical protein